jgi:TonB family protein
VQRWRRALTLAADEAGLRGEADAARARIAAHPRGAHCEPSGPDTPMPFEVPPAAVPEPGATAVLEPPVEPVEPVERAPHPEESEVDAPTDPFAAFAMPITGAASGEFARDVVARTIRSEMSRIRRCYEQALRGEPDLRGMVLVRFTIEPSGAVSEAAIDVDAIGAPEVGPCIARAVSSLRFAPGPPDGPVTVRYPFIFRAEH